MALTTTPGVWAIAMNAVMLGHHLTINSPVYALHSVLRPGSDLDGMASRLAPACAVVADVVTVGILSLGDEREPSPAMVGAARD